VLAKILETDDKQIFALGHVVSGHTLKHLAAAAAGYWVLRMLKKRRAIASNL
jgi:pyruvate/2-oxoglutarate dehydrogenase complex dihydrolipoamide dehydrogenase (E3) component